VGTEFQDLLKPEILSNVKHLELVSKVIVDGFMSGLNKSNRVGSGIEFSQYRSYEPGDDLRLLDWKMLARSGRYYIKQSEIETNISVKFILDASNSMQHKENGISKIEFTRLLIASLGYLARTQGDALGLFAVNEHQLYSIYPRVQKQHFNRFLHQLIEIKPEGRWPKAATETESLHDRRHRELIIVISDMYQEESELIDFVISQKTMRNEVIMLRVMGGDELDMSYSGTVTLEDLESGNRVKIDSNAVRKLYKENLSKANTSINEKLIEAGIGYEVFRMDEPIDEALNLFLKRRKNLL
jgi:uncharacterized protein (DUF58 family)